MSKTRKVSKGITLDWSKLLGFDQVARATDSARPANLQDSRFRKVGEKPCTIKIGGKIGTKDN